MVELSEKRVYYVYAYLDPTEVGDWSYKDMKIDQKPFYIGEGKSSRRFAHLSNVRTLLNKGEEIFYKKDRIIARLLNNGLEPTIVILKDKLTKQEACDLEVELVAFFGKVGEGILSNLKDGGNTNQHYSNESKEKMSESSRKRVSNPIIREKLKKQLDEVRLSVYPEEIRNKPGWLENKRQNGRNNVHYCQGWNKGKGGYTLNVSDEGREIRRQTCRNNFKGKSRSGKDNPTSKQILEFDENMNFVREYHSREQCYQETKICHDKITRMCNDGSLYRGRYLKFKINQK